MAKVLTVGVPLLSLVCLLAIYTSVSTAQAADRSELAVGGSTSIRSNSHDRKETFSLCLSGLKENLLGDAAKATGAPSGCHYGKLVSHKEAGMPRTSNPLMESRDFSAIKGIERYLSDFGEKHGNGVLCAEGSEEKIAEVFWSCFGPEQRRDVERAGKLAMENKLITLTKCESTNGPCDPVKIPAILDSGQKPMCCSVMNNPFISR